MKSNNDLLDKLMQSANIKNFGLKKESVANIINSYEDIVFNTLLENGHLELGNGMILEVVQLIDRVHVLRGVSYKSNRKYKLKLTMEDEVYQKIADYYDRLQEEVL